MAGGSTMASLAFLDRLEGHLGTKWYSLAVAIPLHLSRAASLVFLAWRLDIAGVD
jgi:hypothetical protein